MRKRFFKFKNHTISKLLSVNMIKAAEAENVLPTRSIQSDKHAEHAPPPAAELRGLR